MASKTNIRRRPPLKGFSFYFDLNGKDVSDVEKTITSLGGSVDNFLSNRVSYFIRDRVPNKQLNRKSSRLMCNHVQTRGSKILKKVYESSPGPTDITPLDKAKRLGISIHTFDKVTKWVAEIKTQYPEYFIVQEKSDVKVCKSLKIQQLKAPFLKAEDRKGGYQPLYKEFTSFPTFVFGGGPSESPFCTSRPVLRKRERPSNTLCVSLSRNIQKAMCSSNSKKGFCELCECYFAHRGEHIKSKKHRSNVIPENFKKLDELIKNGDTFSGFLKGIEMERNFVKPKSPKFTNAVNVEETDTVTKKRVRITTRKTAARTLSKVKLGSVSSILKTKSSSMTFVPRKRKIESASSCSKTKKRSSANSGVSSSASSMSSARSSRKRNTRKSKRSKHRVLHYVAGSYNSVDSY